MRKLAFAILLYIAAISGPVCFALVYVGGGKLSVDVGADFSSEGNLFANSEEVQDLRVTLSPGVSYEREKGRYTLNAAFITSFNQYLKNRDQNSIDYRLSARLDRPKVKDYPLNYNLGIGYALASVPNEDVGAHLRSSTVYLSLAGQYDLYGKWAIAVNTGYITSQLISSSGSDTSQQSIGLGVVYRYSPKLDFIAGDNVTFYSVTGDDAPEGYSHAYYGGVDGEITPKIRGKIHAGWTQMFFDDSAFSDDSGLYLSTSVTWTPLEKTQVMATVSEAFSVTSAKKSKKAFTSSLNVSQKIFKRVTIGGIIGFDDIDYVSSSTGFGSREDKVKYVGVSLSYDFHGFELFGSRFMEGVMFNTVFRVSDHSSTIQTFDYKDIDLTLGTTYQY